MTIRLPEPIIAEYYVRRLRFNANQMTGELEMSWGTKNFDVVNTADISDVLHTPNTWLVGWGEIHYEVGQVSSHGTIVDYPKEISIQVVHPFNMALIQALSEKKLSPKQCRSWEAILFSLGWRFKLKPVGQNGAEEAFFPYPDSVKQAILGQPEVVFLQNMDGPAVEKNIKDRQSVADYFVPLQTPSQQTEQSEFVTVVKELQLLQTQQLQLMTKILEKLDGAPSNNGS